jgi:hypothetical protein
MIQAGTGKRYGAQSERGEIEAWGGIVSARLCDYAGAFDVEPQAVLDAVEAEGIEPAVDTAEAKGRGSDRERPTEPELRCLAFTREDFRQLVAAVSEAVAPEAIGDGEGVGAPVQAAR